MAARAPQASTAITTTRQWITIRPQFCCFSTLQTFHNSSASPSSKNQSRPSLLPSRTQHTSLHQPLAHNRHYAYLAPSPKIRETAKREQGSKPSHTVEEYLPSPIFLKAAHSAGAISITPDEALTILRKFLSASQNRFDGWEKHFATEENVSPATLTMLSLILSRSPETPRKMLATNLILAASSLGDGAATVYILTAALASNSLQRPEYSPHLGRLRYLALQEARIDAMILWGRILQHRKQEEQAFELFQKASKMDVIQVRDGISEDVSADVAAALEQCGHILMKRNDNPGAMEVFRRAALELDSPTAYHALGVLNWMFEAESEVYFLKAAASGVIHASHYLGMIQWQKAMNVGKETGWISKHDKHIAMAQEWFTVGADGGDGSCMIGMAALLKAEKKLDEAQRWLWKATKVPAVEEEAKKMLKDWPVRGR